MSAEEIRRFEELAVSRLLGSLSDEETEDYITLRGRYGHYDEAAIESVLALAHLAVLPVQEPAPRTLREAVGRDADEFFGNLGMRRTDTGGSPSPGPRVRAGASAGWWAGLAAGLLTVAVFSHFAPQMRGPTVAATPPPPPPAPSASAVPAASRSVTPSPGSRQPDAPLRPASDLESRWNAFLVSHPHAIQRAWRPGGDPTGERVVGDVVWDEAAQSGYMRFVNLRRNEPNAEQYQLWIFDAQRDQRYPVDGGVFDLTAAGGEQIVPIHAKLPVGVPLVFAVTVEHRGGVVVSDRSRIAAIANVT